MQIEDTMLQHSSLNPKWRHSMVWRTATYNRGRFFYASMFRL